MGTLAERLQAEEHRAGIGRVGELQRIQTGEGDRVGHAFGIHADFAHLADHLVGTLQRRAFRHLHAADQVELILRRNKAARHGVEHKARARQQQHVDAEHRAATTQRFADQPFVAVRAAVKETVERTEQPAEQAIDNARRDIFRRMVILQQLRRQRWRQRQRVDGGDHRGNGDGDRELLIELAGDAGEKRHRHEHGAEHQRDSDNRPGNFAHRLMGGRLRREAQRDITLDVLHYHDGVIHHDADRQHQPEQAQGIEREAEQVEYAKGPDHRNRHRQQRNNRGAPGLQKQDHDQHHQGDRFQQRMHHRADGVAHEHGRVVRRGPLHVVREARRQLGHFSAHRVREIDGVGARRLENTDADRVLIVELRAQRIAAGAHLDTRHVAQPHQRAVVRGFQDDIAELLLVFEAARGVDREQKVGLFLQRFSAELTGRHLHVLLLHRRDHVGGGQAARGDLVGIEPDAHRIFACAEDLNLAHARQARQLILHLQRGVVAQVERVVLAVRREHMHYQRQRRRHLLGGDAEAAHILRQACFRLGDAVLHLHLRLIGIGAGAEGDGGHQHAVGTGHRFHIHHIFNAVDRLFQRRRHRVGNHLRVSAGIFGAHLHAGRHHVRVFADRQQRNGDQAGDENQNRQNGGEYRPVDKKAGKVHSGSSLS